MDLREGNMERENGKGYGWKGNGSGKKGRVKKIKVKADIALPGNPRDVTCLSRHQLLCSTYEDEIWRQSFLCGWASRVEQFASGSSSRGQSTLF